MEKECSVYKAVFKAPKDGILTRFSLEVTIYGECQSQIWHRLLDTARDMGIEQPVSQFKLISIERK